MDLFEAFGFGPGVIVAAVGGGGKTSLVYSLANEAAGRGRAAAVTTTGRFTRPRGSARPPCTETTADGLGAAFAREMRPGEAHTFISAEVEAGRMAGFPADVVGELPRGEYVLAIEADGSAHRPFKAPAAHEPAIPATATDVVVCVGLSVLGHPLSDNWVHRPGLVSDLTKVPKSSSRRCCTQKAGESACRPVRGCMRSSTGRSRQTITRSPITSRHGWCTGATTGR